MRQNEGVKEGILFPMAKGVLTEHLSKAVAVDGEIAGEAKVARTVHEDPATEGDEAVGPTDKTDETGHVSEFVDVPLETAETGLVHFRV